MAKILIIEDEPDQAMNLRYILEFSGFEVITAENGKTGVEKALLEMPDLILSDVNMPVMNGYEVLETLRSAPETYAIPILFLTANRHKEDQRFGMELGADDYITKPYTSEEIINAVNARIKRDGAMKKHFEENINNLRRNIALALPHELNTPISSILGFSQMIKSQHSNLTSADIENMCDNIYESGERLTKVVKKFNNYITLMSKSPDDDSLKSKKARDSSYILYELARQTAEIYERSEDLVLDLADLPAAVSDSHLMLLAEEIIDNAFKFSQKYTEVVVKSYKVSGFINIEITNSGRGMTPEEINKIGAYMQFRRESYEQQGLGLGLAIAKRITELYKGALSIKSVKNRKTTVTLSLPLPEGI